MCGIAVCVGEYDRGELLRRVSWLTDHQSHRGPDGSGLHAESAVALGHRRLAIIALEDGAQPLCNETHDVWVVFNGEIYNFLELRSRLQKLGHTFRGSSDTEILVHAWEQWGAALVDELRGMYAFAIADHRQRVVFLARDPFGIKPLFCRTDANGVTFASELEPLASLDPACTQGDTQALMLYLLRGFVPSPLTIYSNIRKVLPGELLTYSFSGKLLTARRTGPFGDDYNSRPDVKSTEEVISESVRAHLVADVPFGVFLSGGVDSTLVALAMARELGRSVAAFSIEFDGADSEMKWARRAAHVCGAELHEEVVAPPTLEDIDKILCGYGEPFADSSAIPTWFVSRLARRFVPMVLSGDGGDEIFGGYDHYLRWYKQWQVLSPARWMRSLLAGRIESERAVLRWFRWRLAGRSARWREWRPLVERMPHDQALQLLRNASLPDYGAEPPVENPALAARGREPLDWAQAIDCYSYLPDDILMKVDVASMAHGLEVRTPLIDRRVFTHSVHLAVGQRVSSFQGRPTGKSRLKEILAKAFDGEFAHRGKCGFGLPLSSGFLPPVDVLRKFLIGSGSVVSELCDGEAMTELIDSGPASANSSQNVWSLLCLELWSRRHPRVSFARLA